MTKPRKKPQWTVPWWLSDNTELCSTCSQAYAYHTEVRCVECDSPLCPICVQATSSMELSCPDCVSGGAVESEGLS